MKFLCKALAITAALVWAPAQAQQENTDPAAPPPIPPKVPNEDIEPSVTISDKDGERIEEYSQNGRVYMIKITPITGPAYYYLDENGDGQLELSESDRGHGPVRPVYWKLKEW